MDLELRHLRCLVAIADAGTFTDADHTAYIAERWPHVLDLCVERIETWLVQAGFCDVRVTPQPESRELVATWARGRGIENFVASATIEARKPRGDKTSRG